MEQSKKTMRHFYCRDVLWETFERMANDFDCSIDYLINESMRSYAKTKNYQLPASAISQTVPPSLVQQAVTAGPPPLHAPSHPPAAATIISPQGPSSITAPLPHPVPVAPAAAAAPVANPAMVPQRPLSVAPPPAMSPSSPVSHAPPIALPRPPMPPPRPSARSPITPPPRNTPDPSSTAAPALYLHFNNEKFTIDKDQFIIGRGTKSSDLPIKDGNISRKHAAVIRRNGTYYIKDLGSTNGIDYKGMRIDNKRIDEGDIFHLCDYELRFTYQG